MTAARHTKSGLAAQGQGYVKTRDGVAGPSEELVKV